jgi:hypothetical protein
MSAFASVTLQNNAAANVVFNPTAIDSNGVAQWYVTNTVYDARWRLTQKVSLPKNGGTVARVKQRIAIPIMDSIDASKKVAEGYVDIEFVLPKTMSETNRLDLRKLADTLLTNAITTAAVQNLESIY